MSLQAGGGPCFVRRSIHRSSPASFLTPDELAVFQLFFDLSEFFHRDPKAGRRQAPRPSIATKEKQEKGILRAAMRFPPWFGPDGVRGAARRRPTTVTLNVLAALAREARFASDVPLPPP
jgi:hypothetical protein